MSMHSIHLYKWQMCRWIECIPGGTQENDVLETGIMEGRLCFAQVREKMFELLHSLQCGSGAGFSITPALSSAPPPEDGKGGGQRAAVARPVTPPSSRTKIEPMVLVLVQLAGKNRTPLLAACVVW